MESQSLSDFRKVTELLGIKLGLHNLNSALYLDLKFPWRRPLSANPLNRNLLPGALGTIHPATCSPEGVLRGRVPIYRVPTRCYFYFHSNQVR